MYELFIEGQRADIDEKISVQLTLAIDDVAKFGSRETGFSKQIVLTGTANNNAIFGHVYELGNANEFSATADNIGAYFNVAQTSRAELRLNGLLILKGVFRITGITKNRDVVEYEGALFGELGGFINAIANKKIEDLDFSAYDHVLNVTNIKNSWDAAQGIGYFYPLIDYGTYSTNKVDYDIRTLRPALYAKEYLDKIFEDAGFTYESAFFDTAFFKSLIVPVNTKDLQKLDSSLLNADFLGSQIFTTAVNVLEFDTAVGGNFTINPAKSTFTYTAGTVLTTMRLFIAGTVTLDGTTATIAISINGTSVATLLLNDGAGVPYTFANVLNYTGSITTGDVVTIDITRNSVGVMSIEIEQANFDITADPPTIVTIGNGDTVDMNYTIPKGIFQKDFFSSILKMFNLYVDEDKLEENKLIIEPYIDYYSAQQIDWTYKIARDKSWQIEPMGNLNGRIFEFKYRSDNDFYNEQYQKKYQQNYADRQFDTGFQFSQDRVSTEIIFASSPLVKYTATDKTVTAIYKKSSGNSVDQEERTESQIRILQAKKITGVTGWDILDGVTVLDSPENYGYAGHLDDPDDPTIDINFGAPSELYCSPNAYTSNNLFNLYWSTYIAEIADKDSKLLKCYVYLNALDIANIDFSIPVFIDGVKFRLNKIEDYDYTNNELVKVELLKQIS